MTRARANVAFLRPPRLRPWPCALLLAAVVLLAAPGRAEAGLRNKHIDLFFITPIVGAEVTRIGVADFRITLDNQSGVTPTLTGLAYGVVAGVRLGIISLALDFQRTDFLANDFSTNKIYGQLGINAQLGPIVFLTHFDFGYSALVDQISTTSGFGGKVGFALDIYPVRVLSIGAGASFDGAGYAVPDGFVGSLGGSFLGRIGIHL